MKSDKSKIKSLNDPNLVSSKQIFDGHIIQLYVNELKLENEVVVEREIIHHLPAVCILATKQNQVVLVKQYRPAVTQAIYEIPAGIIDMESDVLEEALSAAKRELEEETGFQARDWKKLQSFYVSPGYLDEKITLFHAENLIEVENPLPQDENENVTVHWFSKEEAIEMMKNNEIIDLKTLFALQYWLSLN